MTADNRRFRFPRMARPLLAAFAPVVLIALAPGAAAQAGGGKTRADEARPEIRVEQRGRGRPTLGQSVFQILLGEIALQRRNLDLAANAYSDLSLRTRDPKVLARTIEVASYARRYDLALEVAQLWVDSDPASSEARQALSGVLVALNRLDELAPHIAALFEQDKANLGDNLLGFSRMISRYQDKAAAYRLAERVTAPYPGVAEAHFALGVAAANAGDGARALAEARRARELRPDWENAALLEAQIAARQSPAEMLRVLGEFVERHPAAREARLHLARGLIGVRRYEDARRQFDVLRKDHPESVEVLYPLAVLALQQNDAATAEPLLRRLMELPGFAEPSVAAFYLGQIAEDRKDFADALAWYARVGAGEHQMQAQVRFAQILARQGNVEGALRHVREAAAQATGDVARLTLAEAQILRDAKREAEAARLLEQALAEKPEHPDFLYDAALLAERLGQFDRAEQHLQRLIELKPDSAHAYNALGYSLAERGVRLDEARRLIARALELAPDDPFIQDSMGWVLFRQGKPEEALTILQRAYAQKADAEIAAHLGEVLWTLGRRDEARRIWNEARQAHPDNEVLTGVVRRFLPSGQ